MSTATIENLGPIKHLSFPVPEGGIVVLMGRNGCGKSTALEAVESLVGKSKPPSVRDGELRGVLTAFGAEMKVGRTARRSGEVERATLVGRLSIAEVVDPGIEKPEAADAKRIKALVALSGVGADPAQFYHLAGDQAAFEAMVPADDLQTDDPVLLSARVKRRFEEAARGHAANAQHALNHAATCRAQSADVDLTEALDGATLQKRLEEAIGRESALAAESGRWARMAERQAQAQAELQAVKAGYAGPTVEDSRATLEAATVRLEAAEAEVERLEAALTEACRIAAGIQREVDDAQHRVTAAADHARAIAGWESTLALPLPEAIPDEALAQAASDVAAAREAIERGAIARRAAEKAKEAESHESQARIHEAQEARCREAAKGVDEVLSDLIGQFTAQVKVEAGRLVTTTERGKTYYAELSHGERWRLALDIAIAAVGDHGLLICPQEAWAALDPLNRNAIDAQLRAGGVVMVAAECSADDTIHAEVYQAEAAT